MKALNKQEVSARYRYAAYLRVCYAASCLDTARQTAETTWLRGLSSLSAAKHTLCCNGALSWVQGRNAASTRFSLNVHVQELGMALLRLIKSTPGMLPVELDTKRCLQEST